MSNSNVHNMKTLAYAAPKSYIKDAAKMLKDGGYDVTMDNDTMKATMDQDGTRITVAMAMRMGGRAWSLRALPDVMRAAN